MGMRKKRRQPAAGWETERRKRKRRGWKPRRVCVAERGLCTSLLVRKHTGMCSFSLRQFDEDPGLRFVGVQRLMKAVLQHVASPQHSDVFQTALTVKLDDLSETF